MNYQEGIFHSDHTSAFGGSASNVNAENGGPGVIYLYGRRPLNKNLRIDNRGKKAVVKSCRNTLRLPYSLYLEDSLGRSKAYRLFTSFRNTSLVM